MSKYCCNKFKFYSVDADEASIRIVIIKLSDEFVKRGFLGNNRFRYLIMKKGERLGDELDNLVIEYCPFCGKRLSKIYVKDEYINVFEHPY